MDYAGHLWVHSIVRKIEFHCKICKLDFTWSVSHRINVLTSIPARRTCDHNFDYESSLNTRCYCAAHFGSRENLVILIILQPSKHHLSLNTDFIWCKHTLKITMKYLHFWTLYGECILSQTTAPFCSGRYAPHYFTYPAVVGRGAPHYFGITAHHRSPDS